MNIIIGFLFVSVISVILTGFYLELNPQKSLQVRGATIKKGVFLNITIFIAGIAAIFLMSINDVMAAGEAANVTDEISLGMGLAMIGIGLPTGLAAIAAGKAVASVGSASLAVITEKPEIFGRTLVYLGLAEGIAIYGLVVTILMLGKI